VPLDLPPAPAASLFPASDDDDEQPTSAKPINKTQGEASRDAFIPLRWLERNRSVQKPALQLFVALIPRVADLGEERVRLAMGVNGKF